MDEDGREKIHGGEVAETGERPEPGRAAETWCPGSPEPGAPRAALRRGASRPCQELRDWGAVLKLPPGDNAAGPEPAPALCPAFSSLVKS